MSGGDSNNTQTYYFANSADKLFASPRKGSQAITIGGKDGSEAKAYQEKEVNNVLQKLEEIKRRQEEEQE